MIFQNVMFLILLTLNSSFQRPFYTIKFRYNKHIKHNSIPLLRIIDLINNKKSLSTTNPSAICNQNGAKSLILENPLYKRFSM